MKYKGVIDAVKKNGHACMYIVDEINHSFICCDNPMMMFI